MKLHVLIDNHTYIDQYYLGEPGFCCYMEVEDHKILFDVGYSDAFLQNAEKMGIDMNKVDIVVLSHSHNDHTGGLVDFFHDERKDVTIVAHPDVFHQIYDSEELISSPMLREEVEAFASMHLSSKPFKLTNRLWFLGEIPQIVDFEERVPIGQSANGTLDYTMDDSALAYEGEDGLYIITGCSHAGICNICEYAKEVSGHRHIQGILGGFHLFHVNDRVKKTVAYFQKNHIEELYPCHCTSFAVRAYINNVIPVHEVGVNLELELL